MSSGKLWLHQSHVALGDRVSPLRPLLVYKEINDVEALSTFVLSTLETHGEASNSRIPSVYIGKEGMQVRACSGEEKLTQAAEWSSAISLCSCEVIQLEAAEQKLIAVGRRGGIDESSMSNDVDKHSMSNEKAASRMTLPFSEVWVLIVDGDEATLQSVLNTMSTLGAIRSDFQSLYDFRDRPIGSGACSKVFVAKRVRKHMQTRTSSIANPTLSHDGSDHIAAKVFVRGDHRRDASQMSSEEAAFLVDVQSHPNVVRFYGHFMLPEVVDMHPLRWALAMEWCCRGDLHEDVERCGVYDDVRAAAIMVGTLSALAHIHARGIVHRDVKAENILLGDEGRPVLSDFGIAARIDDDKAMTERCGSPGYAAPEVLMGKSYCSKVDVFGAGVVLYFIMSKSLPFAGLDIGSVLRRTERCRVKFTAKSFRQVSVWMKKFIFVLLERGVALRPSAKTALHYLWANWNGDLREQEGWLQGKESEVLGEALGEFAESPEDCMACVRDDFMDRSMSLESESHEAFSTEATSRRQTAFSSPRSTFSSGLVIGSTISSDRSSYGFRSRPCDAEDEPVKLDITRLQALQDGKWANRVRGSKHGHSDADSENNWWNSERRRGEGQPAESKLPLQCQRSDEKCTSLTEVGVQLVGNVPLWRKLKSRQQRSPASSRDASKEEGTMTSTTLHDPGEDVLSSEYEPLSARGQHQAREPAAPKHLTSRQRYFRTRADEGGSKIVQKGRHFLLRSFNARQQARRDHSTPASVGSTTATQLSTDEAERPSVERPSFRRRFFFKDRFSTASSSNSEADVLDNFSLLPQPTCDSEVILQDVSNSSVKIRKPSNSETSSSSLDKPARSSFEMDVLAKESTSDSSQAERHSGNSVKSYHSIQLPRGIRGRNFRRNRIGSGQAE